MLTKYRQPQFVTFVQSNLHTSQKREQLSASGRILTSEHLTATLTKDIQLLCYSSDSINSEILFFKNKVNKALRRNQHYLKCNCQLTTLLSHKYLAECHYPSKSKGHMKQGSIFDLHTSH